MLRAYLRDKFAIDRSASSLPRIEALEFVIHARVQLWPNVPVVLPPSTKRPSRLRLPADVTGDVSADISRTVTSAGALVPNLKRIALVGVRSASGGAKPLQGGDQWPQRNIRDHRSWACR